MEEITVQEVARRLGKNERTIRRWVHTNRIAYRVASDGRLLFPANEIERLRSEQPPSPTIDDALTLIHTLEGRITALEQALARLTSPTPSTMPRQVKTPEMHDRAKATVPDKQAETLAHFAERHGIADSTYKRWAKEAHLKKGHGNRYYATEENKTAFYERFHIPPS